MNTSKNELEIYSRKFLSLRVIKFNVCTNIIHSEVDNTDSFLPIDHAILIIWMYKNNLSIEFFPVLCSRFACECETENFVSSELGLTHYATLQS
jgi:hypothetical protein